MATDATGTPTSLGIPTYDVTVDAPSGNGNNAQMQAIDTLLQARPSAPSGMASGEAMIWNGTTFVRSSITGLNPSGIAGYPANVAKGLRGDGSWQFVPGMELDFAQITSGTTVTTTTEATATTLITGNSVNYDGNRVKLSFMLPETSASIALIATYVLFRDSDTVGHFQMEHTGTTDQRIISAETFDTPGKSLGTVTISIATPGVVTLANHGLVTNNVVYFSTTGSLPTGINPGTPYYVVMPTTNTFEISSTPSGSAISTSGAQSGTQSVSQVGVATTHTYALKAFVSTGTLSVVAGTYGTGQAVPAFLRVVRA